MNIPNLMKKVTILRKLWKYFIKEILLINFFQLRTFSINNTLNWFLMEIKGIVPYQKMQKCTDGFSILTV